MKQSVNPALRPWHMLGFIMYAWLILFIVLICAGAFAQSPVPLWTVQHPSTVSGVAVNDFGQVATSCYDGNVRKFSATGSLLSSYDVTPGTTGQDLRSIAARDGTVVWSRDYAVAIRDDGSICLAGSVPTASMVRGISKRGLFAVADDLMVYNLAAGLKWPVGNISAARPPMGVCEDGANVWTCGLDGYLREFTATGQLRFAKLITTEGLNSVDVSSNRVVVTDWAKGVWLLDKAGNVVSRAVESTLVYQAKFLPDGNIVYGTHDGRLCAWDGVSVSSTNPPPALNPKSKRGKR